MVYIYRHAGGKRRPERRKKEMVFVFIACFVAAGVIAFMVSDFIGCIHEEVTLRSKARERAAEHDWAAARLAARLGVR